MLLFRYFFPYTDEYSNASAFDKQLHTLLTDVISEKEFMQIIILLFVGCGGVLSPPAMCVLYPE